MSQTVSMLDFPLVRHNQVYLKLLSTLHMPYGSLYETLELCVSNMIRKKKENNRVSLTKQVDRLNNFFILKFKPIVPNVVQRPWTLSEIQILDYMHSNTNSQFI